MWKAVFMLFLTALTTGDAIAVMSIDLGSEFMKISIVKPGVPMEIALNKESQRKTNVIVAMRDGERTFGGAAVSTAVKYPRLAYQYMKYIFGKEVQTKPVKDYLEKFPYYKIESDPETGMVLFLHDGDKKYTPEQLFAMILEYAKELASDFAEQPINEAVITVPPFFNQIERRVLARAVDLAGIKLLQLMNDNTAVALNYGIFRRKSFNTTVQNYMFFDMGASQTTVTVVSYQVVKAKNPVTNIVDSDPQLTIKGVGYDKSLGGLEWTFKLRNFLAQNFEKTKKTKNSVFKNDRAMAKLFKEADRIKQVLSANVNHFAQIENVMDDEDFKLKVTRSEFEDLTSNLFDRVKQPIIDALKTSEITMDEINEVILMGGGTRMPKVQEIIKNTVNRQELGKSINTDEAAALGAVYQAAHLSKGFRVKRFLIKDAVLYPIQVEFHRVKDSETKERKLVKRLLFNRMNPFPQKKVMTFNKHFENFDFTVSYGDLNFLSVDDLSVFGKFDILNVKLTGVDEAQKKFLNKAEAKGVKAHFKMDDSGILSLDRVESVFERPADAPEEESTFQKLGSTITNLFGGSKKEEKDDKPEEPKAEEKSDTEKDSSTGGGFNEKIDPEESANSKNQDKINDDQNERKIESSKAEQKDNKDDDNKTTEENGKKNVTHKSEKNETKEENKPSTKPKIYKEHIKSEIFYLDGVDGNGLSESSIKASKNLIKELKKIDNEKSLLLKSKNDLESYINEIQNNLLADDYQACSKEEEREKINIDFAAASDWFYEQDDMASSKIFQDKLKELKEHMKDIEYRVKERKERPQAWEAIKNLLNYSDTFIAGIKNFTGENNIFTQVEYDVLEKMINSTKDWVTEKKNELKNSPEYEKPVVTTYEIYSKGAEIDREVKYLVNKAKNYKPPKPPVNKTAENVTDSKPITPDTEESDFTRSEDLEKDINIDSSEKEQDKDESTVEQTQNAEKDRPNKNEL